MTQGILFDLLALMYGPVGADFLSEVLRADGLNVEPIEVSEALARLPIELLAAQTAIRTEDDENDYNRAMIPALLASLGVPDATDAQLFRIIETLYDYSAYHSLYPETLSVLSELHVRGCQMGVTTNWAPSLHRLIREFGLDQFFTAVVSSAEEGVSKPDPFLFQRALKRTGVAAEATVHVGPSLKEDVAGALAAGIRPIWLNRSGIPTGHEVLTITDLRGLLMLVPKAGE